MSVSAARFMTTFPVRSEPVNWMKSHASTSAPPVSPMPVTTSKTSGAPISSFQARTSSNRVSGVNSDGLITRAQPATSAGMPSPSERINGKFQGLMTPATGKGRWTIFARR